MLNARMVKQSKKKIKQKKIKFIYTAKTSYINKNYAARELICSKNITHSSFCPYLKVQNVDNQQSPAGDSFSYTQTNTCSKMAYESVSCKQTIYVYIGNVTITRASVK